MQEASAQFAQDMYQHVADEVAKLVDELAAFGTDLVSQARSQTPRPCGPPAVTVLVTLLWRLLRMLR